MGGSPFTFMQLRTPLMINITKKVLVTNQYIFTIKIPQKIISFQNIKRKMYAVVQKINIHPILYLY